MDPLHFKLPVAIKINFQTVAKEISFIETAFLTLCRRERNLPRLINIIEYQFKTHIVTEYFQSTPFIVLLFLLKVLLFLP